MFTSYRCHGISAFTWAISSLRPWYLGHNTLMTLRQFTIGGVTAILVIDINAVVVGYM